MCYSGQVVADYRDFKRITGAKISLEQFFKLYVKPTMSTASGNVLRPKTPRALDLAFRHGTTDLERQIADRIAELDALEATETEQELFKQKKRVVAAQRVLAGPKPTKKAAEDVRIGTNKIAAAERDLKDLRRTEPKPGDSRIFPNSFCPVMIAQDGERVIMPMRYHCRPAWMPASSDLTKDRKTSGKYNARRDKLGTFWAPLFGRKHAVMIVTAFYENVERHKMEHRELAPGEESENVVLEFRPQPEQLMFIACLYDHWTGQDGDLWSFAAITDEPPPEVAAAGHDRCIIQIKPENLDAWLNPDPKNLEALQAILDDRPQPHYEHRVAAAA